MTSSVTARCATWFSHLVVVSGQNIALLLGVGVALLTAILSRRHAALLALALLPGYVVLVGAEPPVVRAAIMAVGLVLASAGGRRTPAWVYLAYAVALMLAVEPSLVRDVAFQLSATATAGVMLLAPPLRDAALAITRRRAEGVAAAFVEAAATATGAALAVLPVQIGAFGEFSLLTVPANVLAAPLYEATVVVAAAAAALGWWDPAAELVGGAGRYVPRAFIAEVSLLARLPGARVPIEAPIAAGAAVYAALAAGAWLLDRRIERPALAGGGGARFALTAGLAIAAGGLWYGVLTPVDRLASVTVLDVGQGLAVLVQDARERVLIDAGPPDGAVLAALGAARLSGQLAAVVVTHDDADHAGGVPEVVRRLDAARVLAGGELEAAGTPLERIDIGDRIHLGRRTTIEVLSPPVATPLRAHASDNDGSLVLLVTIGSRRVLVAADIEVGAESWLVASGLDLRADALIVPHHGSNSSSSAEFIAAVAPRLAVISAGAGNSFGHPHPAVLERYAAASAEVLRTDLDGSVTLRSDGESLWVGNER